MSSGILTRPKDSEISRSLRPLFLWLKCIGVKLELSETSPRHQIHLAFALFMLALNVTATSAAAAYVYSEFMIDSRSKTFMWNMFIHQIVYMYRSVGSHLSMIIFVRKGWKDLWTTLTRSLELLELNEQFYRKIRRMCIFGLLFITAKVCFMLTATSFYFSQPDLFWDTFFDFIVLVMDIFPSSYLVLFIILALVVSLCYQHLHSDIKEAENHGPMSENFASKKLEKWKRIHLAACNSANHLNRCFGLYLFIEISYTFISVVNNSFYVLASIVENQYKTQWLLTVLSWLGFQFILLNVLTHVVDSIPSNATTLVEALRPIEWIVPSNGQQLHRLISEVHYSIPSIKAAGYFTVGRNLIPVLIGTTMTYLIILVQFHRDETF